MKRRATFHHHGRAPLAGNVRPFSIAALMPLYKYVANERVDILKNSLIRFTQPAALNDPFDFMPAITHLYSERFLHNAPEVVDQYLELTRVEDATCSASGKRRPAHIAHILNSDRDELIRAMALGSRVLARGGTEAYNEVFSQKWGLLCLAERCDNLLMWGHYSRDHQGFVIEFNRDHQFFVEHDSDLHPVRYSKRIHVHHP